MLFKTGGRQATASHGQAVMLSRTCFLFSMSTTNRNMSKWLHGVVKLVKRLEFRNYPKIKFNVAHVKGLKYATFMTIIFLCLYSARIFLSNNLD